MFGGCSSRPLLSSSRHIGAHLGAIEKVGGKISDVSFERIA